MAKVEELTFVMKADTRDFERSIKRTRRRLQWSRVVLPMCVGFALAIVSGTVGFLLGLSA